MPAQLVEVVVWAADFVNGLQAIYRVGEERVVGPIHRGEHGSYQEHRLVLEADERIKRVEVASGGVVDGLSLVTTMGRRVDFGGKGGERRVLEVSDGLELVGFVGGVGGHLHNLGIILGQSRNQQAVVAPLKCPWGSYTPSPILRAARDLAMGPGGKEATIQALVRLLDGWWQ